MSHRSSSAVSGQEREAQLAGLSDTYSEIDTYEPQVLIQIQANLLCKIQKPLSEDTQTEPI